MTITPPTPKEFLATANRLHPVILLQKFGSTSIDDATIDALWQKSVMCWDLSQRAENLEYILELLHDAFQMDPDRFLVELFVPWTGISKRLADQMIRISDDFARLKDFEAYSIEDTAHIATKIYRPIVADIFDPMLTLLSGCYEFLEGKFVDIETSNLSKSERSKSDFVLARVRKRGGPLNLLDGYNPLVRNALSHPGSDGVTYEGSTILFRNIKRQIPLDITTVRWSHEELHYRVLQIFDFINAVRIASEIFACSKMDRLLTKPAFDQVYLKVLDKSQRASFRGVKDPKITAMLASPEVPLKAKFELISSLLFIHFRTVGLPCNSAFLNTELSVAGLEVPITSAPVTDEEIRESVVGFIRYLLCMEDVGRANFSHYRIRGVVGTIETFQVQLPAASLSDHRDEKAGLIDLLSEAWVWVDGVGQIGIECDLSAVQLLEDKMQIPRFPRRGRDIRDHDPLL